jgi:radical SAM superfamily enzyme YgiQ (UPF0313 family)
MRKIVMAALDWTRPKDPPMSLGHASIIANFQKHNIEVTQRSWSVNHTNFNVNDVIDFAMSNASDNTDFALGAFVWNEPTTQKLLTTLKKLGFPGKIIIGGPQVSYTKKYLEAFYPQGDLFIRGYGEQAMVDYTLQKEASIGLHVANTQDLGLSTKSVLESLPSPFLSGVIKPQRFIRWETQRGCPFRCAFCQHREPDSANLTRRNFDADRVLKEVDWIVDNPIIQDIAVLDPIFNSGGKYMEILRQFAFRKFTGKIALQCRMEMVTDEFLDIIVSLNKYGRVVLECGLQTIFPEEQKLIDRANNMKKVTSFLNKTRERSIDVEVSLIYGLPGQSLDSFKKSVEYCKEMQVPVIRAFPLMLLRGTPMYEMKSKLGLVESSDVEIECKNRVTENISHVISSPTFTFSDWQEMSKIAQELDLSNEQL